MTMFYFYIYIYNFIKSLSYEKPKLAFKYLEHLITFIFHLSKKNTKTVSSIINTRIIREI